jgi:hypothetical protein
MSDRHGAGTYTLQTNIYDPAGLKPAIPASEQPKTYVLNGAATGFGFISL